MLNHLPESEAALRVILTPQHPGYRTWAEQLLASAPEFAARFQGVEDLEFLEWLVVHGVEEWPDLAGPHFPPLPPAEIRTKGCTGGTAAEFSRTGLSDAGLLLFLQEVYGQKSPLSLESVYDFGAGAGRVLRWLQRLPGVRCIGSDVLSESVAWCAQELHGEWFVSGQRPPLPLPDHSVDLVYGLSIFSHFGQEAAVLWIEELRRVCSRDGLIVISTHGPFALALTCRSKEHQRAFRLSPEQARVALRNFEGRGHLLLPYSDEIYAAWPEVEREQWGQAFFTESWARRSFGGGVEILGVLPAGWNLLQDLYVLRPR